MIVTTADAPIRPVVLRQPLVRAFDGASLYAAWVDANGAHTNTDTTTITAQLCATVPESERLTLCPSHSKRLSTTTYDPGAGGIPTTTNPRDLSGWAETYDDSLLNELGCETCASPGAWRRSRRRSTGRSA
jgi:hypothetical protein